MGVTIADVAKKAGVSKTTVSLVLNNKDTVIKISPKTREKVLKAVEELNYRPNYFARGLNTNKSMTIGVVLTNASGVFMNEIIHGIEKVIYRHGYHMLVCTCNDDQAMEREHIENLEYKGVDGFLIFSVAPKVGEEVDYSHLLKLRERNIPLVLIDRYLPDADIDYVVTDDFRGAYEAVSHLIKLGHRRIAHITHPFACTSVKGRLEGYKKALIDAGLEVKEEYIKAVNISRDNAGEVMEELLRLPERPTAVFTVTDSEAIDAFRAIKEAGLKVPEDIALVGFGNSIESALLEVPLTVVDQPKSELGEKAAEILIQKMSQSGITQPQQIAIRPKLIVRESCGAKKKEKIVV